MDEDEKVQQRVDVQCAMCMEAMAGKDGHWAVVGWGKDGHWALWAGVGGGGMGGGGGGAGQLVRTIMFGHVPPCLQYPANSRGTARSSLWQL